VSFFFGDETGEIIFKGDLKAKLKIRVRESKFSKEGFCVTTINNDNCT